MTEMPFTLADYENAKSWPFQEAKALVKRMGGKPKEGPVIFQTGYGPSGLPHIGTFGEVVRTTMVRHAYEKLTGQDTQLICFSDDMDGLRKVPPNLPNQEMLREHLQMPLSNIPDPFGSNQSFSAVNNAKLCAFLDSFGFDYKFISAAAAYKEGAFDAMLLRMLEKYDEVMDIILPTIGEERRQTYSPFLPISPKTGRVLYVPMLDRDAASGAVVYEDEDGSRIATKVTGGAVKLQWKADWAGRWYALGVDYEMSGEDLTESVKLSGKIVRALGGKPPAGFNYQLFLDEKGEKISKSKGNGLTIEDWLRYASPESLSLYMFQAPKKAKKLYFDIIPKTADEYWSFVTRYQEAEPAKKVDNPAWHIHQGQVPTVTPPVNFALLLNIVNASGTSDKEVLRGFVQKYRPKASAEELAALEPMFGYALNYFENFVKPKKQFRSPTDRERAALTMLADSLDAARADSEEGELQTLVFDAGKAQNYENIREWFTGLYETVFGQSEGPRMGAFTKVFGTKETAALIREALAR
ncbi:MAG: lysine--tRNA ligase [bacterium]